MNLNCISLFILGILIDSAIGGLFRQDRVTSVRPQLSGKRTTEPPKDYQVIGYRNQNEIEPIADPSETNQPGAQTGDIEMLFKSLPVIKSLKKPKFFFQASPVRPKNVYGDEMETVYYIDD
ncbi:PREDICTED: uncharacterized protein LOC106113891 isoform X2 [Papilio xuthus]|uniref:Uncharacterized protein LOC106113891 isoform X2 n=1 Tax=Papilio xuthus TaxID=66420 RepID=A0AAJ6Z051_PAPXU|nr:PREDICTED: uncharacterized protein LOC106113891 isoform X2 [Papilio xuthus]